MKNAMQTINCQCFDSGLCMHHFAPRKLFGHPKCVLTDPPADPRLKNGCAIQYEFKKPDGSPQPPPMSIIGWDSFPRKQPPPTTETIRKNE